MIDQSRKRHIAKTITWRLVGTIDTILISWLITGDPWLGLEIGLAEILTKMILYYFHERAWFKFNLSKTGIVQSRKRHLAKTFTWRGIGTMDTMILAWIITGNPFTGLKIGFSELLTKMILYYFHERAWFKFNLSKTGIIQESRKRHLAKTFTWRGIGIASVF